MTQTNAKSTATLEIDALSYGPYGIGRLDGKAIMVPYTAPGDTVEVRITEEKERYAVGEATRVLSTFARFAKRHLAPMSALAGVARGNTCATTHS